MNKKRFILAVIAVLVFVFLYEFLVNNFLFADLYRQTAELWRPEDQYSMGYVFLAQFFFVVMLAFIFTRNYEAKGIGEGVRFGVMFGLLLGLPKIALYAYMDIPMVLVLGWVVAEFVKALGAGIVLSLTYKK
ncbi:hypothetical protein ACFLRA_00615 [Bdellovibrionota bacterium]